MIGGIIGYGAYIPRYRISVQELACARGDNAARIADSLGLSEKSLPGPDEDALTMAVAASKNALTRADILASVLQAVYVGSESHPYAVKPSATIVGEVLGIGNHYLAADFEFACKGGTAALQAALGVVKSGMASCALAVGSDTAQAKPGDILEYAAGAGAAAFIVSQDLTNACAVVERTLSYSSDTPDFWRRSLAAYPEHEGRFTAQPAYFAHVVAATHALLAEHNLQPTDVDHVVFHQPNGKFPLMAARQLGFSHEQLSSGLLVETLGNSYSANSLLGLTAVLDSAKPNQTIVLVSYGSGSGCDAFVIKTTEQLLAVQNKARQTRAYLAEKKYVSYATYLQHLKTLHGDV
ncbi:hydroxymethylglutaryl-CoA synthase [Candidatus Babeliales bacterium]|nr:hydroxymethylglutaryl-CoA synthase [Candidatus Babeliales bacterium]